MALSQDESEEVMKTGNAMMLVLVVMMGAWTAGCDDKRNCNSPNGAQGGTIGVVGANAQPSNLGPSGQGEAGPQTQTGILQGGNNCSTQGGAGSSGAVGVVGSQDSGYTSSNGNPGQQSCAQLGWYGACEGDTLYYCNGQEVVEENCASHGGTCGLISGNEDDGMNCITMNDQAGDSGQWEDSGSDSDSGDYEFYGDNSFESWGMDG